MITGGHSIIYSTDSDKDRAFLKEVLGLPHVDAGGGWLIFGLPPAEVPVHPSDENGVHELYLMTDDVEAFIASMKARGVEATPVSEQRWGMLTHLTLPGGGKLGIYQPRHPSPPAHVPGRRRKSRPRAKAKSHATKKRVAAKKRAARAT